MIAMGMSESDIQSIMQVGGPAALLIFILIGAITMLWKHYLSQVKVWTEAQLADNKAMIEVAERSTNAINNLTELLRASSINNVAYQTEMRSKADAMLKEFNEVKMELSRRRNVVRRR